jgi:hypothetical protein
MAFVTGREEGGKTIYGFDVTVQDRLISLILFSNSFLQVAISLQGGVEVLLCISLHCSSTLTRPARLCKSLPRVLSG